MRLDYAVFTKITYLSLSLVLLLHKISGKIGKWSDVSLRKIPLIEGRSGLFVKTLAINETLFAVILVRRVMSGKNILEYN